MKVKDVQKGKKYRDLISGNIVLTFLNEGTMKAKYRNDITGTESIITVIDNQLEELEEENDEGIEISVLFPGS